MSSINLHFTFNYVQPDEYRFSHDSVFLAREVFKKIKKFHLPYTQILDLCSGCGIVGLDLLFHLNSNGMQLPKKTDFLEIQNIYKPFFDKNVETFNGITKQSVSAQFLNINYEMLAQPESIYASSYDLIISNPPYFRKDQGVLSKSEFKNRCRFFIDSDFKNLIAAFKVSLSESGNAFILLKSLTEHGIDIEKEFADLDTGLKLINLGLIRDTGFYQIKK
ncbi:MAG: methyltransferase [Bdellovibrio sp.]|nr:methyltransferase [Bdellovibrio sp.]